MQDRSELYKSKKWSYCESAPYAKNLEEYIQRKTKNDFFAPSNRDQILKPVLHLGFVTSNKETKTTINLRVSCYLNDNC
jgi:hypothetical protein